jgi:hypothetical protein
LFTLPDPGAEIGMGGFGANLCCGKFKMVKSLRQGLRGAAKRPSTIAERWPSGLRRTLGKRVYRKVP